MSGTGFPSGSGPDDPAAWEVPVQPGVPDTRQVPTDTQMLDWLIRHDTMHIMGSDTRGWMVSDCSDGLVILTRGHPTYRAAIAAAMKEHP